MNKPFQGKCLLVTGGTGSLGKVLVRRLTVCRLVLGYRAPDAVEVVWRNAQSGRL